MADQIDSVPFNAPGELFGSNGAPLTVNRFLVAEPKVLASFPSAVQRPRVLADFQSTSEAEAAAAPVYVVHTITGPPALVRAERITTQHQDDFWQPGGAIDGLTDNGTALSNSALDQVQSDLELMSYLPKNLQPTRPQIDAFAQPARRKQLMAKAVSQYGIFANPEQTVTRGSASVLPAQRLVQPTPFQSSPYKNGCRAFFSNTVNGA